MRLAVVGLNIGLCLSLAACSTKDDVKEYVTEETTNNTQAEVTDQPQTPAQTSLCGHYTADVDYRDHYIKEANAGIGADMADVFEDADLTLNIAIDLNEDGKGQITFDFLGCAEKLKKYYDDNFDKIMETQWSRIGGGDEDINTIAAKSGYEDSDAFKQDMLKQFDKSTEENGENVTASFDWKEDGSEIVITLENGKETRVTKDENNTLTFTIDENIVSQEQFPAASITFYKN